MIDIIRLQLNQFDPAYWNQSCNRFFQFYVGNYILDKSE